jgi:hypothetical protein
VTHSQTPSQNSKGALLLGQVQDVRPRQTYYRGGQPPLS